MNKINAGTIARTIILALALINQCLAMAGISPIPIEDEQVVTIISTAWTVVASLWSWWKNNSVTQAAIEGDKVMHGIKQGERNA